MNSERTSRVDSMCVSRIARRDARQCYTHSEEPDVMKTNLRLAVLGVGLVSLLLGAGCADRTASAEDVPTFTATPPPPPKPSEVGAPQPALEAPGSAAQATVDGKTTNAAPVASGTNQVGQAITPETINPTPALAEVIRLLQAGVSEEVVMAYVTNSTEVFGIGSNEILYLHDLGAPPTIITTLIQHDSTPEAMARKQAANAVKPLPPGVALNTPATNLFPKAPAQAVNNPPEPVPVNPPADTASTAPVATAPATVAYPEPVEQPANVSYFYTSLAPYGGWVDVAGYGHCWRPTVAVWNSSWRPYADGGRWLWTDRGWYWYSDYSWGWAPFHYGRWACPAGVGWVWVPDVHWGPAWVSWRYSSAHCGWAPLPPSAHFVFGHGFRHNGISVGFGFDFGIHDDHYVFVPTSRFCDRRPLSYCLTRTHARSVYRESTVVNNYVTVNNTTVVNNGVGLDRVANVTRGGVRQVSLRRSSEPLGPNPRREVLGTDGTTLTVANPVAPVRPASGSATVRGRNQRDGNPGTGSSSLAGGSLGSTVTTPPSSSPSRGGSVPPAALPQQRTFRASPVTSGRGALRNGGDSEVRITGGQPTPTVTTTPQNPATGSGSSAGNTPSGISDGTRSPRSTPSSGNSSRQTAYRQTIQNPYAPSAAPASPNASPTARSTPSRTETRPETSRRSADVPSANRTPISRSTEVVTPRFSAPAPSAPAPSRAESYRSSNPAPAPSRGESYRSSSPTPAPSRSESYRSSNPSPARESAPSRSSDGGSRSSRSSDDGNGRRGR